MVLNTFFFILSQKIEQAFFTLPRHTPKYFITNFRKEKIGLRYLFPIFEPLKRLNK